MTERRRRRPKPSSEEAELIDLTESEAPETPAKSAKDIKREKATAGFSLPDNSLLDVSMPAGNQGNVRVE